MSKVMKAVPLVVFCALINAVPSVSASWLPAGVPLCTATGDQGYPTITSDGAGGAIVTWFDERSGNRDIYAQRVNASGTAQWTTNGVALCTATGDQSGPQITSDGAGGAIVTWYDYRSGNAHVYAQRVNAAGAVQWTADGVELCAATGGMAPTIVSDGAGGAIVTWEGDYSSGDAGIYAQRVNASGAVVWTADGIALSLRYADDMSARITSDGAGGAIVTWMDFRRGIGWDIYAQRMNASGAVQWTAGGVALCVATASRYPTITSDGAGGAIVTWWDIRNASDFDVYAQRVNAMGAVQWTANGVALCAGTGDQYYSTITSDGAGGSVVTWIDTRSGNNDIYAQRVNASGAVQWTTDGVDLGTALGDQQYPTITSDGVGGAIVTWQDYRSGTDWDVYAQRVDAAGHTVVATLVQNYAANFSEDRIAITWTLSEIDEGIAFSVERATASDGPFIELPSSAMGRDRVSFTFTDSDWQPNTSYWYRVECKIGSERKVLFETGPVATPALPLTLFQNSPNPFNPFTTIGYYLPEKCRVRLEIFDISGRRIASLLNKEQEKGRYAAGWNGRDEHGNSVASGIYFYKLAAGKETISRKMVLLR